MRKKCRRNIHWYIYVTCSCPRSQPRSCRCMWCATYVWSEGNRPPPLFPLFRSSRREEAPGPSTRWLRTSKHDWLDTYIHLLFTSVLAPGQFVLWIASSKNQGSCSPGWSPSWARAKLTWSCCSYMLPAGRGQKGRHIVITLYYIHPQYLLYGDIVFQVCHHTANVLPKHVNNFRYIILGKQRTHLIGLELIYLTLLTTECLSLIRFRC